MNRLKTIKGVILGTVLILVGFLVGCSGKKELPPLEYLPKDCSIIGQIDVERVMQLDIVKKQLKEQEEKVNKIKKAGVGPEDMAKVYFGVDPAKSTQKKPHGILVVVLKKEVKIEELANKLKEEGKDVKKEKLEDEDVYSFEENDETVTFTQLGKKMIAVGDQPVIAEALKISQEKAQGITKRQDVMSLCNNGKRNDMVWIAGIIPPDTGKDLAKVAPGITNVFLYLNYQTVLEIGGALTCKDDAAANKITAAAMMVSGMLTMDPNSGISPNDIQVKAEGSKVTLNIKIPQAVIDKFSGAAPMGGPPSLQTPPPLPTKPAAPIKPATK